MMCVSTTFKIALKRFWKTESVCRKNVFRRLILSTNVVVENVRNVIENALRISI